MAERDIVIDSLGLVYEGIFSVRDLYKHIDEWLKAKGYDKKESRNLEIIKPEGKYIELVLEPWKRVTDYAGYTLKIKVQIFNLKDVEIEKDKTKMKMNQGKVQITFFGFLDTDYENRWEGQPVFYFIRTLFDKYFYKPFTAGFDRGLKEDVGQLHSELKAFLNLYRF